MPGMATVAAPVLATGPTVLAMPGGVVPRHISPTANIGVSRTMVFASVIRAMVLVGVIGTSVAVIEPADPTALAEPRLSLLNLLGRICRHLDTFPRAHDGPIASTPDKDPTPLPPPLQAAGP